ARVAKVASVFSAAERASDAAFGRATRRSLTDAGSGGGTALNGPSISISSKPNSRAFFSSLSSNALVKATATRFSPGGRLAVTSYVFAFPCSASTENVFTSLPSTRLTTFGYSSPTFVPHPRKRTAYSPSAGKLNFSRNPEPSDLKTILLTG